MSEVCTVVDTDQFAPGKSVDKCGFYSISLLKHAGKPGQSPTGSSRDVDAWASAEYTAYDGPDVYSNNNGMTMGTLEAVLHDAGLHYQVIASTELGYQLDHLNATYIRGWLHHGYPVVIAVAEDDVFDLDLGAKPYAWDTTGYYHIITATGVASDGSLLCHDTASIDTSGVRRGPRRYDAARLQNGLTSATAVVMPWLARPTDTFDPLKENTTMPIPANWKDENGRLIAPNGHYFKAGFRDHVLNAPSWDTNDVPLEEEQQVSQVELHAPTGAGARQLTASHLLIYTQAHGVKESACGAEIAKCYNLISSLEQQLRTADAEIATLKAHTPPASGAIGESITALQAQIASLQMVKSDAEELVKIAQPLATGLDVALVTAQNVVNKLQGH